MNCSICHRPIFGRHFERVTGWQSMAGLRASGAHGGSDIVGRRGTGEFACALCVDREKHGIHPQQETLV